ncbi:anaerobic ribonucleoside-triphosphate reductase [Methanocella sp. CWC-04]|uniref:Anaerobic ribonucleoside-triphosphate reductase n=1 Tax=Methanooceanicella nereidis TaxID=2052831 RepID=A0AAP2REI6_9EURY|nr:anaerobic ribonucleoside-triphosphate reductase [Methanocella sp. CWC-04]MCD1294595.1 anaerobic ribonucleoside-triphosphate reductase [Methanocella sp. CWC-04]
MVSMNFEKTRGDGDLYIIKSDNRIELFDLNKVVVSLIKSGISYKVACDIADDLQYRIQDGITTRSLRTILINMIDQRDPDAALKYKQSHEMYVRTSRGTLEPFNSKFIEESLVKETNLPQESAAHVAREVEAKLRKLKVSYLTAPLIREITTVQLLEEGFEEARSQYTRLGMPVYDVTKLIEQGSKENANLHHNPETIHKFAGDQIIREYLLVKILPKNISDAHMRGDIHLHDADYFAIRPNCLQHDLSWFFKHGLRVDGTGNHTSVAGPPKHGMVAALHAAKILASSQTNMAGGQSFDNFNIFMAPFFTGKSYDDVKQVAQAFVYEMNMQYVARGGQVVFSNMDIDLTVPKFLQDIPAVGPKGKISGTYGDYHDELVMFTKALLDVFLEGDALGKPHLFPNLIVKVRDSAFKDREQNDMLFKVHQLFSKYGTPYILNLLPEWQHDAVNSMGCRTRLSGDWADKQGYENPMMSTMRTGNIHYNTVNLPRIALEANGDDSKVFEILDSRLDLIKEALVIKHELMEKRLYQNKLLPFLTQKNAEGEEYYRFRDVTHTVGFVGLNEFVQAHTGTSLHESVDAYDFGMDVLRYMRDWAEVQQELTGWRWTLTQTPAESTAGRFAKLDMRHFGDRAIVNGDRESGAVYYTNSSHIKVDADISLFERAKLEGNYHPVCNGGHIAHLFLGEGTPDPAGLMSLTEKLCRNTSMGLFDYTRDLTTCKKCTTVSGGLLNKCPNCGASGNDLEYYSRITGYCQRIGSGDINTGGWNDAKIAELRDRKRYCVN